MTDTLAEPTTSLPKPRYMSQAKTRQLIHELALGNLDRRQLASKFGITYQYMKEFALKHKEEIDELRAMVEEKQRELWAMDPFHRALERVTDIDSLNAQMAKLEAQCEAFEQSMGDRGEPLPDQWMKLMDLKHKLLRQLEESAGQLPVRSRPVDPGVQLDETIVGLGPDVP